jgi:phage baseplate assembly protein W
MAYKTIEINGSSEIYQRSQQTAQFYKGFSSVDPTNFNTRLYDFDLIKQDILNHFNTKKGERVMNPEFGSIIWDLLMEPLTDQTRELLKQDIIKICNSDPRVTPTQMDLTEYPNGYILELTLVSVTTNQAANMKLIFDQKIGLRVQ